MTTNRRNFLRLSGAGLLATQAPSLLGRTHIGKAISPVTGLPFELGIASYTFREFSLEETLAMTARLGIPNLCLKSMHLPLDLSPDEIKAEAAKVSSAGIEALWSRRDLYENQGRS